MACLSFGSGAVDVDLQKSYLFIYFLGDGIGIFKLSVQIALSINLFLVLSTGYVPHVSWKGNSFCVL